MTSFIMVEKRLRRRHELDGAATVRWEKQRKEAEEDDDGVSALLRGQGHGDDVQHLLHASAKPEVATGATGTRWKITDGEVSPAGTVLGNYRIATRFKSQITPKIAW